MFRKYGASRDHSYKFHNLVLEEREKNKENDDFDKLIDDNDNNNKYK